MGEMLYKAVACHMLGDYALQSDFLASTKGESWWHLAAHCVLYTVPFAIVFGIDWRILCLFSSHMIVDAMKARWGLIGYASDQATHLIMLFSLYLTEVVA